MKASAMPPLKTTQSSYLHTIGMVLDQHFPPDPRVMREATALIEAGHTVHLLCLLRENEPETEAIENIHVHRIAEETTQVGQGLHRLPYKIWQQWQWAKNTVVPGWQQHIETFAKAHKITLLHAHDLRIAPTVLASAKALKLPTIVDLHENYPDTMRQLKGKNSLKKGEKAYKRWLRVEKEVLQTSQGVIAVVEEMRERLLINHPEITGLAEKIAIVSNAVDLSQFTDNAINTALIKEFSSRYPILVYVGHINAPRRGIQTVIAALPHLVHQYSNLLLLLAGQTRPTYETELRTQIAALKMEPYVHFTGALPEIAFASMISVATMGLCPLESTEQTEAGLANKMFQYHAYAKPVLSSNTAGNQRYLEETGGGLTFKAGDVDDCAHKLLQMLANPQAMAAMGNAGQKAVRTTYNWQMAKQPLLDLVETITAKDRG